MQSLSLQELNLGTDRELLQYVISPWKLQQCYDNPCSYLVRWILFEQHRKALRLTFRRHQQIHQRRYVEYLSGHWRIWLLAIADWNRRKPETVRTRMWHSRSVQEHVPSTIPGCLPPWTSAKAFDMSMYILLRHASQSAQLVADGALWYNPAAVWLHALENPKFLQPLELSRVWTMCL